MDNMLKKSKGITLIALAITIILLLILSGVSIQLITGTGLFESAKRAKLEDKRSQVIEYLNLKLLTQQMLNSVDGAEKIIKATREDVYGNINELKRIGKEVTVEETTTEEDGKEVEIYFYVIVDNDIYKVEMNGVNFIGNADEMVPIIKIEKIENTTNSITVHVVTMKNKNGKLKYYIKSEDDEEYKLLDSTTEEKYTYENLVQEKKYLIKVVAVAKNKKTAEVIAEQITGKVTELTTENAKFIYTPDTWTNGDVTATVSTEITGYTIQTSTDEEIWENTTTQTLTANGEVYARLWDGKNAGKILIGNVTNIDKIKPSKPSITTNKAKVNANNCSFQITVLSNSTDNVGIKKYQYSLDAGKTYSDLSDNTTVVCTTLKNYTVCVRAVDLAGNVSSSSNSSVMNPKRNYIKQLYSGILGRTCNESETTYWENEWTTAAEVVRKVALSNEGTIFYM